MKSYVTIFLLLAFHLTPAQAGVEVNEFGNFKFTSGDLREIFSLKLEPGQNPLEIPQLTEVSFRSDEGGPVENILLEESSSRGSNSTDHYWVADGYVHFQISFINRGPGIYCYLGEKYCFEIGPGESFEGLASGGQAWDAVLFAPVVRMEGQAKQSAVSLPTSAHQNTALQIWLNYAPATLTLDQEHPSWGQAHQALLPHPAYQHNPENDLHIYEHLPSGDSTSHLSGTAYIIPADEYARLGDIVPASEREQLMTDAAVREIPLGEPQSVERYREDDSKPVLPNVCPVYCHHWSLPPETHELATLAPGDYIFIVTLSAPDLAADALIGEVKDRFEQAGATSALDMNFWKPLGAFATSGVPVSRTAGGLRLRIDPTSTEVLPLPPAEIAITPDGSDADLDLLPDPWEIDTYGSTGYNDGTHDRNGNGRHDLYDFLNAGDNLPEGKVRLFVSSRFPQSPVLINRAFVSGSCFPRLNEFVEINLLKKSIYVVDFSTGDFENWYISKVVSNRSNEPIYTASFEEFLDQISDNSWSSEELSFQVSLSESARITVEWTNGTDPDGDGLSTSTELRLGTDPQKKDTDGDGVDDNVEVEMGSDPTSAASTPETGGPGEGGEGGEDEFKYHIERLKIWSHLSQISDINESNEDHDTQILLPINAEDGSAYFFETGETYLKEEGSLIKDWVTGVDKIGDYISNNEFPEGGGYWLDGKGNPSGFHYPNNQCPPLAGKFKLFDRGSLDLDGLRAFGSVLRVKVTSGNVPDDLQVISVPFLKLTEVIPAGSENLENYFIGESIKIEFRREQGNEFEYVPVIGPTSESDLEYQGNPIASIDLLPVDLAVDANRNGEVEFGTDQTTAGTPYRFWINNDYDYLKEDEEDPTPDTQDHADERIGSQRELEDFARIQLMVGGFHEQLKSGDIQVAMKFKEGTVQGNPAINLWKHLEEDGGRGYLSDENIANRHTWLAQPGRVTANSGYTFLPSFWTGEGNSHYSEITSGKPYRYLLFEGAGEGKGELVLEFKKGNQVLAEVGSCWVKLLNVRKMYQRVKVTPDHPTGFQDPFQFVPNDDSQRTALPPVPEIGWVWDPWNNDFVPDPEEEKKYMVFVHGWRMTYNGAQKYGETMFKRLWQEGYKGRYAFVRWPTQSEESDPTLDALLTYNTSDYRAWKSGKGVAQFVNSLHAEYTRSIAAHSMGNIVVSSAVREGMQVESYALLNAAIPAMCYDPAQNLYVFDRETPDGDSDPITQGLGFKSKISNTNGARLINFYLPADSALLVWAKNNRLMKPLGDALTGYRYVKQNQPGERVYISQGPGFYRWIRDEHEAMAFATASRTRAVGAEGGADGSISAKHNMDTKYSFGSTHSAQWLFRIQKTDEFYSDLIDELKLK